SILTLSVCVSPETQHIYSDSSLMSSRYFKSKRPTPQQTQTQTCQEVAVQANETEEEHYYGNLAFLQGRP
ncbi:hypothetical protein ATANTOWER_032653, partial [Ataeniobius toweri]|nr:hypothetical protein [Ataeniobius toweri]